jgi:hypothetical protein
MPGYPSRMTPVPPGVDDEEVVVVRAEVTR